MNIFDQWPTDTDHEAFTDLLTHPEVRIERIISHGHITPEGTWYDQTDNEWVIVIEGEAKLAFDDGTTTHLKKGDHCYIPAHRKHRVNWTAPHQPTLWLAVFF